MFPDHLSLSLPNINNLVIYETSKVSNGQTEREWSVTLADLIENYIKQRLLNSKINR